jgi:class 3 adenylate cyclase
VDIATWLRNLGLERYTQTFLDNEVDLEVLSDLTEGDLEKLGIPLGHRKKLLRAITRGAEPASAITAEQTPDAALQPSESIEAPRAAAERRQLTVLFRDLVGSTALAARLDPKDMGAVMRAYHGACTETVERWGGHVAKYMGDGVLAYFGWPQAHEDEAERAVRAGLDLAERVSKLDAASGTTLMARIGIATGLVMVGELIGEGAAREQTVVGETPNLAARLQVLAAPGRVVISQATRRIELFERHDFSHDRVRASRGSGIGALAIPPESKSERAGWLGAGRGAAIPRRHHAADDQADQRCRPLERGGSEATRAARAGSGVPA